MAEHLKLGTKVTWTSQAGGTWKTKTGTIIAFIPSFTHIRYGNDYAESGIPRSRTKGQMVSQLDRYLVEVPRGGKSNSSDYYTPFIGAVKQSD